jgi:ankyrin repeat protein
MAEKLLSRGANINHADSDGNTIMHSAIQSENKEAIIWLLEKEAFLH